MSPCKQGGGILCPACGHNDSEVLESRPRVKTPMIYRRRRCSRCGEHFPTSETLFTAEQMAAKRGGRPALTHAQRMAVLAERIDRIQRSLDRLQAHVSDLSRLL